MKRNEMETVKTRRFKESINHQPIREEGTDHVIGKSQSRASNSRQLTGLTVLFTIITAIITILSSLFWFGLVWFGLVWFGLVWFGLVWLGLIWFIGVGFSELKKEVESISTEPNVTI